MKTKKTNLKHMALPVSIKSVDEAAGTFTGYASVFGNVDSHREIVDKGAFSKSIKARKKFPMLWSHDTYTPPIGVWSELKEDDKGLYAEGQLFLENNPLAQQVHAAMKAEILEELSIGYIPKVMTNRDEKTGIRHLKEVDLKEISVVLFASNSEARIDAVKETIEAGGMPTMKEFEKLLREAGFSKSQAAAIVTRGYAHLLRSESDNDADSDVKTMLERLNSFKLPSFERN